MNLHSKIKGGLGISAVCRDLISKGIPVFSEVFCDLSDIDIIAEYEGNLYKIQVKTFSSKNAQKSGINWYKDFMIPSFLRDYTCPTLTDNAEGKDIVQAPTDT